MSDLADAEGVPTGRVRRYTSSIRQYFLVRRTKIIVRTLLAIFMLVVAWPFITIVIPAGNVGVVFQPLLGGTSLTRPLREGLRFILPWNKVTLYNTRVQVRRTHFEAVSADGLHIQIGVVYRYRVHTTVAGRLHKAVGPNYASILLDPAINSIVRKETARYTADQVYGEQRGKLQEEIYRGVVNPSNHNLIEGGSDPRSDDEILIAATPEAHIRGGKVHGYVPLVELVDIMITEVRLPPRVREAIEKKEEQQQLQQEYTYRIEREKMESVRKGIEAEGIRNFQQIVQSGISDTYLRWRGIEATLRLATSPNSKTVIIGGGRTGMPLILNTDETGGGRAGTPSQGGKRKGQARSHAPEVPNDSFDLTRDNDQGSLGTVETPSRARPRK